MGTTKSRKTRRNTSRPAAIDFLTNISLGNAADTIQPLSYSTHSTKIDHTIDFSNNNNNNYSSNNGIITSDNQHSGIAALSLHSSDSNFTDDDHHPTTIPLACASSSLPPAPPLLTSGLFDSTRRKHLDQRRRSSGDSSHEHYKLTREDSERPIASEKVKKKSVPSIEEDEHQRGGGTTIMSMLRYYTDKIRQSTTNKHKLDKDTIAQLGYVQQQQLANHGHRKRRACLSYAHFLSPIGTLLDDATMRQPLDDGVYDPLYLDNDAYSYAGVMSSSYNSSSQNIRSADTRKELNELFRLDHPDIPNEITLTKIRAIKAHLLEIGKTLDLEVSTLAHAYVYFEKLVIKHVVTKKNRKLIAACCLFLAFKINEAKGAQCHALLEAIDNRLDEDTNKIHEHEFAVFADLQFELWLPRREFIPHFDRILAHLENTTQESYLGDSHFYEVSLV